MRKGQGFLKKAATGLALLASSVSWMPPQTPLNQKSTPQPRIKISYMNLSREEPDGKTSYEGKASFINIGDDESGDAAFIARLNNVVNLSTMPNQYLDTHSFRSMIEKGTIPAPLTRYLVTPRCAELMKDPKIAKELNGIVSPKTPIEIASETAPLNESEAESVRLQNPSLIETILPTEKFYFERSKITSTKSPAQMTEEEARKIELRNPLSDQNLYGSWDTSMSRSENDAEIYENFSVKPIFGKENSNGQIDCAGLSIDFDNDGISEAIAWIDLRNVTNSSEITSEDLFSWAHWGDLNIYTTAEAGWLLEASGYLQSRMEQRFRYAPGYTPMSPFAAEDLAIRTTNPQDLLPRKAPPERFYHPAEIKPCRK